MGLTTTSVSSLFGLQCSLNSPDSCIPLMLYNFLLQNWPDKKLNLTKNHVTEHRTCSSGQDASSLLPSLLSLSLSPWRLFSPDRLLCGQVCQHGSPSLFSSSSCPLLVC